LLERHCVVNTSEKSQKAYLRALGSFLTDSFPRCIRTCRDALSGLPSENQSVWFLDMMIVRCCERCACGSRDWRSLAQL
jgi:hypothetical protein